MKTKEEMYNYCNRYRLTGIPYLAYPLPWLAKMNFKVIEKNLLDNEEVIFPFMAMANLNDFDNHGMSGNNMNQQDGQPHKRIRHWIAFGFTNRGHLYYGKWRPLSSDSGSVPIVSTNDVNLNLNQHLWPYSSELDIETLRRTLPNLNQTYANLGFIKNNLDKTILSLSHHAEGDDGRRIYDQNAASFGQEDAGDDRL